MGVTSNRPRCYVASPLGFSEAGRHYYRAVYLPALATVVTPVDPWALTTEDEMAEAADPLREREMLLSVGCRNIDAIRSCSVLAAYLDGQELDSGTVAELGFAAVAGSTGHVEEVLDAVERFVWSHPEVTVIATGRSWTELMD